MARDEMRWVCGLAGIGLLAASCAAPRPPRVISDPDPSVKIPAIKAVVRCNDRSSAAQLIQSLKSDDPAVRMFAIEALRRLEGTTRGYRYYDDRDQRRPAIERWQQWLAAQKEPSTLPTDATVCLPK